MDHTGDTKHHWNKDNADEVNNVKALFDALKANKQVAYKVKEDGTAGEIMNTFDPNAGDFIVRPMAGGG